MREKIAKTRQIRLQDQQNSVMWNITLVLYPTIMQAWTLQLNKIYMLYHELHHYIIQKSTSSQLVIWLCAKSSSLTCLHIRLKHSSSPTEEMLQWSRISVQGICCLGDDLGRKRMNPEQGESSLSPSKSSSSSWYFSRTASVIVRILTVTQHTVQFF